MAIFELSASVKGPRSRFSHIVAQRIAIIINLLIELTNKMPSLFSRQSLASLIGQIAYMIPEQFRSLPEE